MKQVLLSVPFFLASLTGTQAQETQPTLHDDALQLAGRLASMLGESPTIPTAQVQAMEQALWAVAHSDLPQAKLVCEEYQIHTFPKSNLFDIQFYVESGVQWAQELANGKASENAVLAKIMAEHQLQAELLSDENGLMAFRLHAENAVNARYIANQLSMVDPVLLTEVPIVEGDGNDISIKNVQGGWLITYSLRFNNCSIVCKNEHSWQFGVTTGGEVVFVGEYGDSLPERPKVVADVLVETEPETE